MERMSRGGRRNRSSARIVAALVGVAAFASACSAPSGDPAATDDTPTESAEAPVQGGTLRFVDDRDPLCVDPQQESSTASMIITRPLVDSLLDQDPETGELVPWLAEDWTVSEDATTFAFTIRDGLTLQDGTDLTADVVRQNIEHVVELGAKAKLGAGYLKGLAAVEVVDGDVVQVAFEQPNAQFLQATTTQALGILAPSSLERSPEELCQGTGLVGSGPFSLDDYTTGQGATIVAWEEYDQASELRAHSGRAYLDRVEFDFVDESSVRTGTLTSGQADAVLTVAPQDEASLEAAGFQILSHVNEGLPYHLFANTQNPILADEAVRQAIQVGFDRQEISDTLLTPTYGVADGALSQSHPYHVDQSDALAYDPDAAGALLDDAGWEPGEDGIRTKDGQRLALRVVYYQGHGQVFELVQQHLAEIGIELTLREITTPQGLELQASGDYDLFQSSGTRADPDLLRVRFSPDADNVARLAPDDELGEVLRAQAGEADVEARTELVRQAQEALIERGLEIPVYQYAIVVGAAANVHGLGVDTSPRNYFYDTWLG